MEHGDCLGQEELTDYLEGGLDPAIKTVTEVHLLSCDKCREGFALLMSLLKDGMTPEEVTVVDSAARLWSDTKVGRKMTERKTGTRAGWLIAVAAVFIAGLVSVPYLLNRTMEPASGREVVQLLLSERRPFEAQLSSQPHLPIVRTRGLEDADISYDLLRGEMERLGADNFQMGRFYLIQKDFSRAIPFLEKAEQEAGLGSDPHNDLGVAYMEAGDEALLPMAAQEFQHVLNSDPTFAPAVFNLAILHERRGALPEAERELRKFLALDSRSPWADEARSKLEGLNR